MFGKHISKYFLTIYFIINVSTCHVLSGTEILVKIKIFYTPKIYGYNQSSSLTYSR
jgi:hypothetical protein